MDPFAEFIALPWSKAVQLRGTLEMRLFWGRMPSSDEYYVRLAQAHVELLPKHDISLAKPSLLERHEAFETLCRELVYFDGRTISAILWIAQWAHSTEHAAPALGVNALAFLKSALERYPFPAEAYDKTVALLQEMATKEDFEHNAKACLRLLKET